MENVYAKMDIMMIIQKMNHVRNVLKIGIFEKIIKILKVPFVSLLRMRMKTSCADNVKITTNLSIISAILILMHVHNIKLNLNVRFANFCIMLIKMEIVLVVLKTGCFFSFL